MADFKSALLTLGDEAFFEIVRNYLGPIRTPFNKHDLIKRLEAFLRRPEIQDRIVGLIDEEDAQLLSAVWMLGEPDFDELYLLFAGERTYLDLHQRLLNLEDRLLVYRDHDRLLINPILRDPLEERVLRAELLFASRPLRRDDPEANGTWVTDTLLVSLYSYAHEHPELFRADHSLRKRARTDLAERIPPLAEPIAANTLAGDEENDDAPAPVDVHRATILVDALVRAGALTDHNGIDVAPAVWRRLASLTPLARLAHLAAAAASGRPDGSHPSDRREEDHGRRRLSAAIEAIMTTLPRDRAMSSRSIERLMLVLAPDQSAEVCRRAREAMTLMGVLTRLDGGYVAMGPLPEQTDERKPLVVQPNFDVTMPEEFTFDDGLFVARIAELRRHDRYPHLELTKERLASALRDGEEFEDIVERLQEVAGHAVPQNVIVTMRSWASEYESIRLFRGIVLTVEEARRHAVEHADAVRSLIRRELAPGIYLVDERDVRELQAALEEAGIELVPEVATLRARESGQSGGGTSGASIDRSRLDSIRRVLSSPATTSPDSQSSDEWLADVTERLESSSLSAEQREELATRVRQKLIVSADQVQAGSVKTEKIEARGLDYVGKVRIIEQAVRNGSSLLEIIERTEDGAPRRRLVEPTEMQKHDGELVLVGEELPDRESVELLVRKLGLVRRVRTGLVKRRPNRR